MRRTRCHDLRHRLRAFATSLVLPVVLGGFAAPAQETPPGKDSSSAAVSKRAANRKWKLDDFSADLEKLEGSRSFEQGRRAFDAALCAVCHRIGDHGGDLGPNLSKPEKPRTRQELLREILEPSRDIEPKYRTYAITTVNGKLIAGVIVEKTDLQVTVRTRPVGAVTSETIARSEIESIEQLDLSMMPDELMSRLTKEEVLDLLAYVEAKGDPTSPLFIGAEGLPCDEQVQELKQALPGRKIVEE